MIRPHSVLVGNVILCVSEEHLKFHEEELQHYLYSLYCTYGVPVPKESLIYPSQNSLRPLKADLERDL